MLQTEQDLSPVAERMAKGVLRMLRPHTVEGRGKIRVGNLHDGGYIMLDALDGVSVAYSLGINGDVGWDLDMARRGVSIRQYDHTIDQLPAEHPLFQWKKIGIAAAPDPRARLDTLENLIRQNGDEGRTDMVLKCDIEGAEWQMLANTPNMVLRQFRQIVLEMHGFEHLCAHDGADVARRAIANLTAGHRLVHVHANNYAPWAVVGGIPIPDVLEMCFARLDLGTFTPSDERFPTPIDMPCRPDAADLYLGSFTFE